jgi:ABC-type antimicrobial peptide transport system permease subunit
MSVERGELLGSRALSEAAAGEAPRSLWRQAAIRFRRNHAAMGSIYVLIVIGLASVLIPMFWPHAIEDASWEEDTRAALLR